MVEGIINAFDHMEFCLVLNLTVSGSFATRYISWLLPFIPGSKYLLLRNLLKDLILDPPGNTIKYTSKF